MEIDDSSEESDWKCPFINCHKAKRHNFPDCGDHNCLHCGNEKDRYSKYCKECRCQFHGCDELKNNGKIGCEWHTCKYCHQIYIFRKNKLSCDNRECQCTFPDCARLRINSFACEYHTCNTCDNMKLYNDDAKYIIEQEFFNQIHVVTDKSCMKILDSINPRYSCVCPNMEMSCCKSKQVGYPVSSKCIGVVPKLKYYKDICYSCQEENKCDNHKDGTLRSSNPIIMKSGLLKCDDCTIYGKCLNYDICQNHWIYALNNEKPSNKNYKSHIKLGPELCKSCNVQYKACSYCHKIFNNNSIEFLEYDKEGKNCCVHCIVFEGRIVYHTDFQQAGMICHRMRMKSFLKPIEMMFDNFNPHKFSYDTVFELSLNLLWECKCKEVYLDCMISFLNDQKNFHSRFKRISKNMMIVSVEDGKDIKKDPMYGNINLLALLVRCTLLPKDLFMMILMML